MRFFQFALLTLVASTTSLVFAQNPPLPGAPTGTGTRLPMPTEPKNNNKITDEQASIQCIYKIPVSAQSDGIIEQLLADEGMTVKKGDVMLMIDQRLAKAEVAVAERELEAAEKKASQTANVDYSKKASQVADAEYEDIRGLYNQGAATYTEARKKQLEAERARASIDVAEVDHKKEQLEAEVAKEKLSAAKTRLELHQVIAPFDGIIVERMRGQGEWIKSGEPVLRLVHMNEMRVEARVPLQGISVTQLQDAPMKIQVKSGKQIYTIDNAKVEFVSPEVDLGRVRVWTRIQNQAPGGIWLFRDGMTASIEITPNGSN